jgi:TetR/AcrR family transcriptional regulator
VKENAKQEQILEAAIKRLSHFGVHKTTFTEIADDLNLTKQALMYYYHDKAALVTSVGQKIASEYLQAVEKLVESERPIAEVFAHLIDMRHQFFEKYSMLFVQMKTDILGRSSDFEQVRIDAQEAEAQLLSQKLKRAIAAGEITDVDTLQTVKLILEMLTALSQSTYLHCAIPSAIDFRSLADKQKQVVHMMINGLRRQS